MAKQSILKAEQELIPTSGAEQRPLAEVEQPLVRHATPFRTISPTTPLFPWTCYSGGFFKMYSLLIWIKSLVFGMYSLLLSIWPLVIALVTLSRHRPLFNNAYSTFVYSQVQSLLMVIGHRSLGSQVTLVLCLRCPGFCVFVVVFWSWDMAVYISGVVNEEILEAHVLALA